MGLSAKQAADVVGITKQGIIKSIRTGRLSAVKNKKNEWQIDPAELLRVYDVVKPVDYKLEATSLLEHTPKNTHNYRDLELNNVELRAKLKAAEQRNNDLENQLNKSEEREHKLIEVVQSQTRLLENTPDPTPPKPRGIFSWLISK